MYALYIPLCKKDNSYLTLTLRCHEDTAWPHHELLN